MFELRPKNTARRRRMRSLPPQGESPSLRQEKEDEKFTPAGGIPLSPPGTKNFKLFQPFPIEALQIHFHLIFCYDTFNI